MRRLLCGCAIAALWLGLAGAANAQVEVRDSPIHAVPVDGGPAGDVGPGPMARPEAMARDRLAPAAAERAPPANPWVKPLSDQLGSATRAAPPTADGADLSPDEAVFFSSLGHRITNSASAYETFVRKAGAIDPAFHDGAGVRSALRTGADYQPQQFQEGIVAFAALLALRDQGFVDAVRAQTDPDFTERLMADPRSVLAIPGADRAAADVTAVLRAQGAALEARGAAITQAAYDVQARPWSREPVADAAEALAATKASAAEPRAASAESEKLLLRTVLTAEQGARGEGGPTSPQVLRGLALAALAVRGQTGDREEARFQGLMRDEISAACLNMVKMNLDQCLAAAGPHYEHVFCVGRHAVGETAKCVSAAATGDGAVTGPLLSRERTASAERYGPEAAASYGDRSSRQEDDRDAAPAAATPAYDRDYAHTYTPPPYRQAYVHPDAPPNAAPQYGAYAQDADIAPPEGARRHQEQDDYAPPAQDERAGYPR